MALRQGRPVKGPRAQCLLGKDWTAPAVGLGKQLTVLRDIKLCSYLRTPQNVARSTVHSGMQERPQKACESARGLLSLSSEG